MKLTVEIATSESLLHEAYGLRYQCLTLENDDQRYACSETNIYKDPWDLPTADIIIAKSEDDTVVGTVRYVARYKMEFPAEELYDFEYYERLFGLTNLKSKTALLDRGAVRKDCRRKKVTSRMMEFCEELSIDQGIRLHVGLVAQDNAKMPATLLAQGWRRLPEMLRYGAWQGQAFVKLIGDKAA